MMLSYKALSLKRSEDDYTAFQLKRACWVSATKQVHIMLLLGLETRGALHMQHSIWRRSPD